jgi:hypothetical protein
VQAIIGGSSRREQVLRRSGRGPGFIAQVESEGLLHPGRGSMRNLVQVIIEAQLGARLRV